VPFDSSHMISYQSSIVAASLYCTVSEILALISQISRGHVTLNAPPYCRALTRVMTVLFIFNLQTKFEMSSSIRSKDMACPKM